jgi:hypothetical protein
VRCYFLSKGHIADVEIITGLSDQEAMAKGHLLFLQGGDLFDGFEVWDRKRLRVRHPDPFGKPLPGAKGS